MTDKTQRFTKCFNRLLYMNPDLRDGYRCRQWFFNFWDLYCKLEMKNNIKALYIYSKYGGIFLEIFKRYLNDYPEEISIIDTITWYEECKKSKNEYSLRLTLFLKSFYNENYCTICMKHKHLCTCECDRCDENIYLCICDKQCVFCNKKMDKCYCIDKDLPRFYLGHGIDK